MADYWIFIVIWLAVFWCSDGPFVNSKGNHKGKDIETRFRRNIDQCTKFNYNENGYTALNESKMEVEFDCVNDTHVAVLKWSPPTVNKGVPVNAFLVIWEGHGNIFTCKVVSNETLSLKVVASSQRVSEDDRTLHVCIFPMPMKPKRECTKTRFTPNYTGRTTHASSTASTIYNTAGTRYDTAGTTYNSSGTRNVTVNGTNNYTTTREDEYSSKLIVGSVIGVGMAIVLIIILVKTFGGNGELPPNKPDTYYISHYPEDKNFVKELKEFVYWLRENGFNVQMLTDENDLLSDENKCLRRELMSFMFREHMIKTSGKIIAIISPLYLRLCDMREEDILNENLSEEEKTVRREIVQIRCELNETTSTNRFIPIRFRLGEMASIPFWIQEFELFSWPEEKTTMRLLNKLNGLPEYPLSFCDSVLVTAGMLANKGEGHCSI